jgi:2,3-dihydroxybiphenyl 1,2-dioxygenase
MNVRALGYMGFDVKDVARWEAFATGIVGLQLGSRGSDGALLLRMDEREQRLTVRPSDRDDLAFTGWEVESGAELQAVAERLRAGGATIASGDTTLCRERGVDALIWCLDPNGVRVEVFHGARNAATPFASPRAISGFITGDQGLGHFVLLCDDPDATLRFYQDALGLRITDFIDFEREPGTVMHMTFLHCNPRHHSVAFMARPNPPQRISHLMLEVGSIDDVGATFSLCEREGVPIAMTLGRHTNDQMLSFYMTTPSGFMIEYGWGGRTVDDATWQVERYDAASTWGHRRQPAPAR